jgi:predicted HTH domain antitoxin
MTELAENIETIAAVGGYEDADAVVDEAVRELLRRRPQLRLSLAIEKYRQGAVSLNRGAELAGVSTERFKNELAERGVPREAGVLDADERAERLEEFSG